MGEKKSYRLGIDIGGTFTDLTLIEEQTQKIVGIKNADRTACTGTGCKERTESPERNLRTESGRNPVFRTWNDDRTEYTASEKGSKDRTVRDGRISRYSDHAENASSGSL